LSLRSTRESKHTDENGDFCHFDRGEKSFLDLLVGES